MDNLTHTLAALALGRAGLNRAAPRAGLLLALAANAADIDVAAALRGSLNYLSCHRGETHGLLAIPLLAVFPVLIVRLAARRPIPWVRSYLVSLAGAASHPLLDWTNVYGVRLLSPFSERWFSADINHLFDVWILLALALVFVWPWLSGLVSSEIGASRGTGRGLAVAALCFILVYDGARYTLHDRALAVLESRIYQGAAPLRVAAVPGPMNPLRWRGIVETETAWSVHDVDLLGEFDPTLGRVYYKPEPSAVLEAARRAPEFREYLRFAQYVCWRAVPLGQPEGAWRVEAMDLRFGTPAEPRFVIGADVLANLTVRGAAFRFR